MQNGQLARFYGDYSAAAITHLVGLISVLIWCFFIRKTLPEKQHAKPWMYLGGVVGIGTLVFMNMAYAGVSVTAIVGLSLLGQSVTSLVVDQFGLLGAPKSPFFKGKLLGLAAVGLGAAVMVLPLNGSNLVATLLALASGVTIVFARTINARLAAFHGPVRSTIMNYVTGLAGTVILMLAMGRAEPFRTDFQWSSNWFMYFGGALGVVLITLLNLSVNKVPALKLTLLQFTGQIFTSLVLDALTTGSFSWQSALGGLLVACGLGINTWMEHKRNAKLVCNTQSETV